MKKAEKIALAMVTALTLVNCGTNVARTSSPLNRLMPHRDFSWSQYAPTGHSSLVQDTSSHSLQTPLLGGAGVGSTHYSLNFSDLEKEYKSFSTKALSNAYVKRMFGKYLEGTTNYVQLIRQLEFSRYLKTQSDTSYENSLKSMFVETPSLYDLITLNADINQKMSTESATFGTFVRGLSPYPVVPVATNATNITSTSFTANWNTSIRATSYKLFINGTQVYSGTATSFNVTGLDSNTTYTYYVKAINNAGESQSSNTITLNISIPSPSAPVAKPAVSIYTGGFRAEWNSVADANSYKLYIDNVLAYSGTNLYYERNGLFAGTSHTYYVQAVNAGGTSSNSNSISVRTLFGEFMVNTYTANIQSNPSIAMDNTGNFIIAWDSNGQDGSSYGIYAQRFAENLVPVYSEFRANSYTTNSQADPAVGIDDYGNLVFAWEGAGSGDGGGIFARKFDYNNAPDGGEFRVNGSTANTSQNPSLSMSKDATGDFVIAWNNFDGSLYNTYINKYKNTTSSGQTLMNSTSTGYSRAPSIAMNRFADFVVSYMSGNGRDGGGYGIYSKFYSDSTNSYTTDSPRVNTLGSNDQRYPSTAINSSQSIIVWDSNAQDGSGYGIYAQRYDLSRNMIGSNFIVNQWTQGHQQNPSVAMDENGNFVVVWQDDSYGMGWDICGQRFDSNGNYVGTIFIVNSSNMAGDQISPSIAMDSDGDFVVTWQSTDGDQTGIFAKAYGKSGNER